MRGFDVEAVDRRGFYRDFLRFGEKLAGQYRALPRMSRLEAPDALVICGMGGSGVVGDVLRDAFADSLPVPVHVNKADRLPRFVGRKHLLIAISYSGNTAETIAALEEGLERGVPCVAISSGGRLMDICRERGVPHLKISRAMAPRSALPEMLAAAIRVVEGALGIDLGRDVEGAARHMEELRGECAPEPGSRALAMAEALRGRIPAVYVPHDMQSVGVRAKTAFNENSKVNAYYDVYPEMFHNEVMAYDREYNRAVLPIVVRRGGDGKLDAFLDHLRGLGADPLIVECPADLPRLAAIMGAIMLLDLASVYLAVLRGVDPYPVDLISALKSR